MIIFLLALLYIGPFLITLGYIVICHVCKIKPSILIPLMLFSIYIILFIINVKKYGSIELLFRSEALMGLFFFAPLMIPLITFIIYKFIIIIINLLKNK